MITYKGQPTPIEDIPHNVLRQYLRYNDNQIQKLKESVNEDADINAIKHKIEELRGINNKILKVI